MSCRVVLGVVGLCLLVAGATGCGLKGSLEMPEQSTNIVIRGPQQAPAGTGTAAPAEAAPTPAPAEPTDPAQRPATKPPADERLPPPPLPGGNTGSARGG